MNVTLQSSDFILLVFLNSIARSTVAVQRSYARLFNLQRHDPRPKASDNRFYAQENTGFVSDVPVNSPKIVVLCGGSWKQIYGPFIFKDEKGAATTVLQVNGHHVE